MFMNVFSSPRVRRWLFVSSAIIIFPLAARVASSMVYSYHTGNTVIGISRNYTAGHNESLIEIARRFGLGYNELVAANPALDPFVPGKGAEVRIPASWVLPDVKPKEGIIINISEMRLFSFFEHGGKKLVATFPIGIGREGYNTPEGEFRITEKIRDPTWVVPESIRKESPGMAKVIIPGPDNPLGSHALRLSRRSILIHGTNQPWGIGRNVSHGCIRLYPEDISILFGLARVGTKVTIIRQPVKIGIDDDKVFLEAQGNMSDERLDYLDETLRVLREKKLLDTISTEKLYNAIGARDGTLHMISN